MTTMRVWSDGQQWLVTNDDPEVRVLFGTDTLPTPFLARAKASVVLAEIRRLNPGADVQVAR